VALEKRKEIKAHGEGKRPEEKISPEKVSQRRGKKKTAPGTGTKIAKRKRARKGERSLLGEGCAAEKKHKGVWRGTTKLRRGEKKTSRDPYLSRTRNAGLFHAQKKNGEYIGVLMKARNRRQLTTGTQGEAYVRGALSVASGKDEEKKTRGEGTGRPASIFPWREAKWGGKQLKVLSSPE